jgi:Flp pilus assembly protein TadB
VTSAETLATACAALAALVGAGRPASATGRLHAALPARRGAPTAGSVLARLPPGASQWCTRLAWFAVAALLLAGRAELALPAALGVAVIVLPARRDAAQRAGRRARMSRDLPRAADLLAMSLDAGLSPSDAVALVCDVVGGPVADALRPIAAALRSGVDPSLAWDAPAAHVRRRGPVDRLGRAFARAASTGAPLAETAAAVAAEERERARWAAEAAARRAGVRAVGPLALCFLPAFVLLGVVPVVAGVAGAVLTGLG